jgi:cytochrome P450
VLLNPFSSAVKQRSGIPMLPGAFPGVGHLPAFLGSAPELIADGRQRFGTLFWLNLGPGLGWHLTLCGKEAFDLLKNKSLSNEHLAKTHPQFITERGLMALEGPAHQRLRSLMSPAFSPRGLVENGAARISAEVIRDMVSGWGSRRKVVVLPDTQRAALDVIFQMLDVPRAELSEWQKQYRHFSWSALPLPIVSTLVVEPAVKWLLERLGGLATKAQSRPPESSLLATLAHAKNEAGEQMTVDELADNMRLLAFAGHETTASAMAWTFIELARNPDAWDKVVGEVQKNPKTPKSTAEMREFTFCEALFREVVRMHPAVPLFSRRTTKAITFSGHEIPENEVVFIPVTDFSSDPEIFDDPGSFKPERWLGRSSSPAGFEVAAFGGGNHFCLGYHLALLQGVQLLVELGRQLGARGLRPKLNTGTTPKSEYLPLSHPAAGTVVLVA